MSSIEPFARSSFLCFTGQGGAVDHGNGRRASVAKKRDDRSGAA